MDEWRTHLYIFGFLSSLAFGGRFLLQWIVSEKEGKSVVPRLFWNLSLTGNLLLLVHSIIQVQFHVCFVQTCNAVISWRNLNLMGPEDKQASFKQVLAILSTAVAAVTLLFLYQGNFDLFRIPVTPWKRYELVPVSPLWHAIGFTGLILFNSRFWIQWWGAERHGKSYLGPAFWWLSLVGDTLCLLYFTVIGDFVNIVGPLFGLVPYIRNLMLLRKSTA